MRKVAEENQPNSTIGRIVAIDKDANQNGKVNYKIVWPNQFRQYKNLFVLTENGKLIAKQSMDRERVPNGYTFTVIAFDSGKPSLSSTVKVHVILDDINDCIPKFSQSEYNFTIDEDFMHNYTGPRIIGMVVATDCDTGLNSMLVYSLLDPGLPFEINSHGLLQTNRLIDRESHSSYQFTVLAIDGGGHSESRYSLGNYQIDSYESETYETFNNKVTPYSKNIVHTSAVTVRILVSDLNDNAPIFVYPNTSIFKVRLSIHEKKGFIVTRLVAVDKDSGRNGEIHYNLIKGDPKHVFGLRHDTGEIIVTKTIQKPEKGSTFLSIQASDRGNPPKHNKIDVEIIITDSPPIGRSFGTLDEYQLANLKALGLIGITEVDNSGAIELNKLIMMCIVVSTTILCMILILTIGVFVKRTSCKNIFDSMKRCKSVHNRKSKERKIVSDVICKENDDDNHHLNECQEEMKTFKEKSSIEFCDVLSHVQYNQYQEMIQKSSLIPKTPNTLSNAIKLDHLLQFVNNNNSNDIDANHNIINNINEDDFNKSTLANLHCDNPNSTDIRINSPSYTKANFANNTLMMGHLECNRLITAEVNRELHTESLPTSVINSNPHTSYSQDSVVTLPRVCAIHGAPGTTMKLLALPLNDTSHFGCPDMQRNLCISPLNDAPINDSDVDSGRGGSVNNIGSSPNSDQIALVSKSSATVFPVHYVTGSLNFSLIPVSVATSLNLTPSTSTNPSLLLPLSEVTSTSTESASINSKKYSKLTGDKLKVTFAESLDDEEIPLQLTSSLDSTKPIIHYPPVSPDPVKKDKGPWRLIQCASNNVKL
ncbi:Protocadherin beta-1 [Schistosoma japonicum]|nr:Protocadherin beta-1 [Schistosoma japonicum]